jgi:hypothetical protein
MPAQIAGVAGKSDKKKRESYEEDDLKAIGLFKRVQVRWKNLQREREIF